MSTKKPNGPGRTEQPTPLAAIERERALLENAIATHIRAFESATGLAITGIVHTADGLNVRIGWPGNPSADGLVTWASLPSTRPGIEAPLHIYGNTATNAAPINISASGTGLFVTNNGREILSIKPGSLRFGSPDNDAHTND